MSTDTRSGLAGSPTRTAAPPGCRRVIGANPSWLRGTLDFNQPVGLLLIAISHFIGDDDDPYGIVERLLAALPRGSYLALSHLTGDFDPQAREGGLGLPAQRRDDAGALPATGRGVLRRARPD
jgi:S-adenosyl methyltransferase